MNAAPLFAVSIYLHLPILIVVISLVYSATRFERQRWRWAHQLALKGEGKFRERRIAEKVETAERFFVW